MSISEQPIVGEEVLCEDATKEGLPTISVPGTTEDTRLIISMLLLQTPITVPTAYLHDHTKGSPQTVNSANELQQLTDLLAAEKGGKARVEIVAHHLNRIANDVLKPQLSEQSPQG